MIESLLQMAKANPFGSPFQTAKCAEGEQSLARSTLVPTRQIAMAAAAGMFINFVIKTRNK